MTTASQGIPLPPGLAELAAVDRRELARGRAAQATLVLGPGQSGKRRLLLAMAAARLCEQQGEGAPCGSCRACRLVAEGQHPDLLVAEAPLKVDGLRQLLGELALRPVEAARRVALLPDVDLATVSAANALLKTLEEPPPRASLLLSASRLDLVLPTLRSRCRQWVLRPAAPQAVAAYLLESGLVEDAARAAGLARRAAGRLEWAIQVAADREIERDGDQAMDALEGLLRAPRSDRLRQAAELARRPETLPLVLEAWLLWLRDALLCKLGLDGAVGNTERRPLLATFGSGQDVATILSLIAAVEDALGRLQANGAPQLVLELLLLEFPT